MKQLTHLSLFSGANPPTRGFGDRRSITQNCNLEVQSERRITGKGI